MEHYKRFAGRRERARGSWTRCSKASTPSRREDVLDNLPEATGV